MIKKTKLRYESPKMETFEFKQQTPLLTVSNPGNYPNGGDPWNS